MPTVPLDQFAFWIICFMIFGAFVCSLLLVFASFRPQKRNVALMENYATVTQLDKVEEELATRIEGVDADVQALKGEIVRNGEVRKASIEGKVEALRQEVKGDITQLHEKINDVNAKLAAQGERSELNTATMARMEGQIMKLVEKSANRMVGV
jgi:hypothetical protein